MRFTALLARTLLVMGALMGTAAMAERACEETPPDLEHSVKAHQLSQMLRTALDANTDDVVLVGLAAQDVSQYGLEYSHLGFAVRRATSWRINHVVNLCGSAQSALQEQSLIEFLSDKPHQYKLSLWRLQPALQARLVTALTSKTAKRLHEPKYSMVAYPYSTQYQNSTAWVIEMLAYSMAAPTDEVVTRKDAQDWLKNAGYTATQLPLGMMTRLAARVVRANVVFDDHPSDLRWTNRIQTSTPDDVIGFLKKSTNACLDAGCPPTVAALATHSAPVRAPIAVQALTVQYENASTFAENAMDPFIAVGDSNQLTAMAIPLQAQPKLEWQSSNPEAVAVDRNTGLVTGVAPGTAEITAVDTVTRVRSNPLRFTTMADISTGSLTWKITPFKGSFNAAHNYCTARGWRLPSLEEASLVRAYMGEPRKDYDGAFDAWRFISEFRTSAAGTARQHTDWYWHPRGGTPRGIDIPDSVGSNVLCVRPGSAS